MFRSLPNSCRTPPKRTSLASARDAILNEHQCAGIEVLSQGSRRNALAPLSADQALLNVAAEQEDKTSFLKLYGKLIGLRKEHTTLIGGKLHDIRVEQNILRYRISGDEEFEVVLNMAHDQLSVPTLQGVVLAGTYMDREDHTVLKKPTLRPAEGLLLLLV
jgi:glycosidase